MPESMRTSLTDYIGSGKINDIVNSPSMVDGIKGYLDNINEKLGNQNKRMQEMESVLSNIDNSSLDHKSPLSQENLYEAVKNGEETGHLTIPDEVNRALQDDFNKFEIKSPSEEIDDLKSMVNDEAPSILSKKYRRLSDLSDVWHSAKVLKSVVDEKAIYSSQRSVSDVMQKIVDAADRGDYATRSPKNVVDYLKNTIEEKINKLMITDPRTTLDSGISETAITKRNSALDRTYGDCSIRKSY